MKKLLLLLCLLLSGCPVHPDSVLPDTPDVEISEQQKELVTELEPYKDERLSEFYAAFADIVQRDKDVILTTGNIREAHVRAGKLYFQGTRESNPELAEKVDAAFASVLGLKNVALDDRKREDIIRLLEALAWAFR